MAEPMEERNNQKTKPLFDNAFLEQIRRQMLKFATLQLSDSHLAEDVVQEALVGALKNARSFGGRSALKSWVFAILKNKIADALRHSIESLMPAVCCGKKTKNRTLPICSMKEVFGQEVNIRPLGRALTSHYVKANFGVCLKLVWRIYPAIRRAYL